MYATFQIMAWSLTTLFQSVLYPHTNMIWWVLQNITFESDRTDRLFEGNRSSSEVVNLSIFSSRQVLVRIRKHFWIVKLRWHTLQNKIDYVHSFAQVLHALITDFSYINQHLPSSLPHSFLLFCGVRREKV